MSARLTGFLLALTGLVILSPDAGLTRFIQMETWSLIFWRGIGLFGTVGFFGLDILSSEIVKLFPRFDLACLGDHTAVWHGATHVDFGRTIRRRGASIGCSGHCATRR